MKKLLAVFAILILHTAAFADESATTMYLHAMQYEREGKLDEAHKLYKELLDKQSSATLYLKVSEMEIKRGKRSNAILLMEEAYGKYTDNVEVAFQTGLLYGDEAVQYDRNSPERRSWMLKSLDAFKRAASLEPSETNVLAVALAAVDAGDNKSATEAYNRLIHEFNLPEYYRYSGLLKIDEGDKKGGIADLKKAAEEAGDIQAYLHLADIYLKDGDKKTAMEYLTKVSKINPDLVLPDLYLGEYYRDKGDYKNALIYYRQAVGATQDSRMKVQLLKQAGAMAIELEDYRQGYELLNEALHITASDQQLFYFTAYAAFMTGDYEAAQIVYSQGLVLYPDYAMLRKRSALNLVYLEKPEEAVDVISLIDPIERDVEYYLILDDAYGAMGDDDAALEALKEGLDAYPGNSRICVRMANIYDRKKDHDMTIEILKVALKFEPDSATLQNYLGYIYADLDMNLDEAEALIAKALKQEPDNYAYIDSMAWVYFRQGKYHEANELMEKALKINPADPELLDHHRQIKEKLKK